MQSGCEDTLEERYAIKFCFILGKNATETYAHTRGLPWGLPEVFGMVQQVHCSQRRLLQRGLEFHVCTINKSAHTKKSLETYLMILVPIKSLSNFLLLLLGLGEM